MRVLSKEHAKHRYFFTDVVPAEETFALDICDKEAVSAFVEKNAIDLIVNCAAYTNVDKAEEDEATAMKINADALGVLGTQGVKVIHVSTDYVFSGDEHVPCRETDPVAPRTAYGRTKYAGEKTLLAVCPEAVILRTAWLYSTYGNNFVKTMIRLGKEKKELGRQQVSQDVKFARFYRKNISTRPRVRTTAYSISRSSRRPSTLPYLTGARVWNVALKN